MHNGIAGATGISACLPSRLQTVMYDPLSYIHPARLRPPAGFDAPAQRAAINAMLLARYDLNRLPAPLPDAASRLMLKHWWQLADIVLLLGCVALRFRLMERGALLRLPSWIREFLRMPGLADCADAAPYGDPGAAVPGHADLLRHGMRHLARLTGGLAPALAARAALLLTPEFDCDGVCERSAATGRASNRCNGDPIDGPIDNALYADDAVRQARQSQLLAIAIQHVLHRTPYRRQRQEEIVDGLFPV